MAVPWWLAGGVAPANCVGAYQAIGAASQAASYVNLANPGTNNLTAGADPPTWSAATGWNWFAAAGNRWLDTGLVPGVGWSMLIQYTDWANSGFGNEIMGCLDGGGKLFFLAIDAISISYNLGNRQIDRAPGLAVGNVGIVGDFGYRNGTADGAALGSTWGAITTPIHIGQISSRAGCVTANVRAVAIYNATLTPAQALAVATRMAALPG